MLRKHNPTVVSLKSLLTVFVVVVVVVVFHY